MPVKLVKLNMKVSPHVSSANKEESEMIPTGTGLQILFEIDGSYYVIAGPRGGKVITVNGGAIDDHHQSFFKQLAEEMAEETFGVLNLVMEDSGLFLYLNDGRGIRYPLTLLEDSTVLEYEPEKYAYVTFTAVCKGMILDKLLQLASQLTPTAHFWNQLGNDLFTHFRNAPHDHTFLEYWKLQYQARCKLIERLKAEYHEIQDSLLIDPRQVFAVNGMALDQIEDALNTLHQVSDFSTLGTLFKHTVGRYSERSGYHVFKTADLLLAAENKESIKDIMGTTVARGIFNDNVVKAVFPALNRSTVELRAIPVPQSPSFYNKSNKVELVFTPPATVRSSANEKNPENTLWV